MKRDAVFHNAASPPALMWTRQTRRMNKRLGTALLALLTAQAGATTVYEQHDFGQLGSAQYQPLLLWCDGPDRVVAVGQPSRPLRELETLPVIRAFFLTSRPSQVTLRPYLLGPADAGLGHQSCGFRPAGQQETVNYFLQMSNIAHSGPEYTANEAYFQEGRALNECRYFWLDKLRPDPPRPLGTVFSGAGTRRSVFIQLLPSGYEYRSFDYAGSTPIPPTNNGRHTGEFDTSPRGLVLRGGTRTAHPDGSLTYRFQNGAYVYRVEVGPLSRPGARVQVTQNGRPIVNEPFRFYSDSRPKERP